jgi:hypothetical protein
VHACITSRGTMRTLEFPDKHEVSEITIRVEWSLPSGKLNHMMGAKHSLAPVRPERDQFSPGCDCSMTMDDGFRFENPFCKSGWIRLGYWCGTNTEIIFSPSPSSRSNVQPMLQFLQRELELKIDIRKTGQLCSGANRIATGQFETGSSRAKAALRRGGGPHAETTRLAC